MEEVERLGRRGRRGDERTEYLTEMGVRGVLGERASGELGEKHAVLPTRSPSTGLVVKPEVLQQIWFSCMSHAVVQLLLARQSICSLL